jgi:hypothetical protein
MRVARALALSALVLLAVPATGAVGLATAAPTAGASPTADAGVAPTQGADDTPLLGSSLPDNETNGTSVHHRDPDDVGEDGDLDAIKGWLTGRMGRSLRESGLEISQGQYEQGRAVLGDEYDDLLGQYVDVAGETDGTGDDETGDTLEETKETQREYADTVEEYEETYEAYQEAKANGNDARARELARELNSLAQELRGYNQRLGENYDELGNQTGEDFTEVTRELDDLTENVTEEALSVQETELVATTLDVRTNRSTVSFSRPLALTGTLSVVGNESPPETATFAFAGENRTVDVAPDGSFTLTYRPTTARTGEQRLNVTYVPDPTSLYLGANASADVTVVGETPTVEVTESTDRVAFGEDVRVAGQVTVNDTRAGGVDVVLTVDGRQLATTRTNADGTFTATGALPASIQPGEVDVKVRAGREDRAVAPNATTTTLTVVESASDLTISGDATGDELVVSGSLVAENGVPVPGQPVQIRVDDDVVAMTRTNDAGNFTATIDAPDSVENVTVRVAFDGTGTNLANTTASTTVALPGGNGGDAGNGGSGSAIDGLLATLADVAPLAIAGLVVVGALAAVVLLRRRRSDDDADATDTVDESPATTDPEPAVQSVADRLENAGDVDTASLVRASYHTLRDAVAELGDVPDGATHWEFYRAVVDDRPEVESDLRRVVETYERVTFAEEPVDGGRAGSARDAALRVAETIQDAAGSAPGPDTARDTDPAAD